MPIRRAVGVALALAGLLSTTALAQRGKPDELLSQQWEMAQVHAQRAWSTTRGRGVVVAVIDSGVDGHHPDFGRRVLPGIDLTDPRHGRAWTDTSGHGTAVASVVAAGLGNGGMVGVAPEATILPIRIDAGNPDISLAPAAIDYAVAHHASVINISEGLIAPVEPAVEAAGRFDAYAAAVERAWRKGVVVVAGAGNNSAPWCSDPAALPHVICVGGVDSTRTHVYYSHIDALTRSLLVVAPAGANGQPAADGSLGKNVVVATPGGGYDEWHGTSFSSPMAAGVAALIAAQGLHGQRLVDRLLSTCLDLGPAGTDPVYGHGEVDALAAVTRRR